LASVAFISLSGVMMPGPVFAVTVAKGYRSKTAGVLIALGHGAVEFPLILLLYFGLSGFFSSTFVQKVIGFVGGVVLVYMGFQTFKTRREVSVEASHSGHASFIAGLIATGANPYFFVWWATVGAALIWNASLFGVVGLLAFATVHWLCDLAWDTLVSLTVFKSRRFWNERIFTLVFLFCFATLVVFGLWFIISTLLW
ncbi:LysE family transporter, partial [Candidatus Bathyarchaeota archaeon]|nr:LysE family transporter [Candidatus Bathyarchaeota archaeon]